MNCTSESTAQPHPSCPAALVQVAPEDLSRFEGEGGLEAPEPTTHCLVHDETLDDSFSTV